MKLLRGKEKLIKGGITLEYKEKRFEEDIESSLLKKGGYIKGDMRTYNAERAIDLDLLIKFIKGTQLKEWQRYMLSYGDNVIEAFYKRFNESVNTHGLIHVLQNGFSDRGVKFKVCYFKPTSTRNNELVEKYEKNILTETRQFAYSTENKNTIDMVLSLNGIPIVAIELKNQITGQSVDNAKKQFMYDRNSKERCFKFNKRFLVYFAVDLYDVAMTTKLDGKKTYFLPFNQGSNGAGKDGGAGNPKNPLGYLTSYLWEKVLIKDSLLNIIQRFLHLNVEKIQEIKKDKEVIKTNKSIIFPRYHQLDCVMKLVDNVREKGSGHNYLIQHSAGSGKSNSIGWLCLRLASLHNNKDEKVFTSVIVVTDRKVLDSQLQATISELGDTIGLIENIGEGKNSKDLRDAINNGAKIIVTTLQKFPVIYQEIDSNKGKRFAVVVDEAHSSQTGRSAQKLKTALADTDMALEEYAKFENIEEEKEEDFEDKLVNELAAQGKHENLSFFAFTATPKQKTLEMFGEHYSDGTYHPFHIYSMKQAIEEGFILNVLKNYMTYDVCYRIVKDAPDNPDLPENEARTAIRRFESLHPYNIKEKTKIMVESFRNVTMKKINGHAKAMLVTASRLHAVRYYHEFKRYIKEKGYTDLGVLIAFSGTVNDKGADYTEVGMNKKADGLNISEKQLPAFFNEDEFKVLIVAEKYQTGFNQPLLHTMFIDKVLKGVKAVQTLSRLNRTMAGKEDTFILDFANKKEDILASFEPYYKETVLDEEINVNLIYDTKIVIRKEKLYNDEDILKFNKIFYKKSKQSETDLGKITSLFKPIVELYGKLNEENQFKFKKNIRNFVKWYAYITQITRLFDKDLQMEYNFLNYMDKLLPKERASRINLDDKIKLEFYKLNKSFEGSIVLESSEKSLTLQNSKSIDIGMLKDKNAETLEIIIKHVNERFDGVFSESDKVIVSTIYNKIMNQSQSNKLFNLAKKENLEVFKRTIFPDVFREVSMECYKQNKDSFNKLFANQNYYDTILDSIAEGAFTDLRNS